ncbi:MAG: dihydrodipicolinate synthase family protein, partial [Boseongicola sp.]
MAIATPLTQDLRPDAQRLVAFTRHLFAKGVDGVTLFGTTGEGPEFSVRDRMATLDAMIANGIDAKQIIVSVSALAFADACALAQHATSVGVAGCLLMPPCMFRSDITDDGVFEYYNRVIERIGLRDLRLFIYNFPDICGVSISVPMLRRLTEKYPGIIAGVKDSGGDPDQTRDYILSFADLAVFTGNEIDVPDLTPLGLTGTVCGMANIMPAFMRHVVDAKNAYEGRTLVAALREADAILSRCPFIPSAKSIIAKDMRDTAWLRLMPPMALPPAPQRAQVVAAYGKWHELALQGLQSPEPATLDSKVLPIR